MNDQIVLSWGAVAYRAQEMARKIRQSQHWPLNPTLYPIPRGGLFVAALMAREPGWPITNDPARADIAIDDIIDSGQTAERMARDHGLRTFALLDKSSFSDEDRDKWVIFPWEVEGLERDAAETVMRLEQMLDMDRQDNREMIAELRHGLGIEAST